MADKNCAPDVFPVLSTYVNELNPYNIPMSKDIIFLLLSRRVTTNIA